MRILITGSKGFIGKNLVAALAGRLDVEVLELTKADAPSVLKSHCMACDFVFHLAGVQRPLERTEFQVGNVDLTRNLSEHLRAVGRPIGVFFASSIQAELDNEYGKTKRLAEECLRIYGASTGSNIFIYRLPHVFGRWGRPNFNSAVNTFCHNVAKGLPITVNDPSTELTLLYVDDLVAEMLACAFGPVGAASSATLLARAHRVRLGHVVSLLGGFKAGDGNPQPFSFEAKLRAAYESYLG